MELQTLQQPKSMMALLGQQEVHQQTQLLLLELLEHYLMDYIYQEVKHHRVQNMIIHNITMVLLGLP